jgi:hypothetical protein
MCYNSSVSIRPRRLNVASRPSYDTVLMAAAYSAILGYAVLVGADYVDAERVKLLNRVPGVRQVVEQAIG